METSPAAAASIAQFDASRRTTVVNPRVRPGADTVRDRGS